ncbi:hypothetical protein LTR37_003935 [Vermiconidia calcicola]|uniref:Uncharacterized protein n=1 Tax=Vermiconidia calcicola TaxID=1690605 RepID=A0ACC3NP24_9PEZI|nr:hypothetical protein LTR37_003935 [Vermiconidia calcicola]
MHLIKTFFPAALAALAVAAPYPIPNGTSIVTALAASGIPATPATSQCNDHGALICSSDGFSYALCNWGHAIWQSFAAGTKCVCSMSGECSIAAMNGTVAISNPRFISAATPPFGTGISSASMSPSSQPAIPISSTALASSASGVATSAGNTSLSVPLAGSAAGSSFKYKVFTGTGDPSEGWPKISAWLNFEELWSSNLASRISTSCADWDTSNNHPGESAVIRKALLDQSKATGIDARFALVIMLQESGGCVRVPTTDNGVTNPGLFQSHNGAGTCSTSPCPKVKIDQMVQDGMAGTASGDGLKQLYAQTTSTGVAKYYQAARMYVKPPRKPSFGSRKMRHYC